MDNTQVHRLDLAGVEKTLSKSFGKPVKVTGIKLKGETHIREGEELKKTFK